MKIWLALPAWGAVTLGFAEAALAQQAPPHRPPPRQEARPERPSAYPPAGGGAYGRYPSPGPSPYGPAYPGYPPPPYASGPYGRPPNSLGADWREQQEEARAGVRGGQMAPLGQVIEEIRRRSPGRQLDAGIELQGGREVYRVRWMDAHGQRSDYIVDAQTGAILSQR